MNCFTAGMVSAGRNFEALKRRKILSRDESSIRRQEILAVPVNSFKNVTLWGFIASFKM
jgi:hypothetical protein